MILAKLFIGPDTLIVSGFMVSVQETRFRVGTQGEIRILPLTLECPEEAESSTVLSNP